MDAKATLTTGSIPEYVEKACIRLRSQFPAQVFSDTISSSSFWDAKQNELNPALRIEPANTKDVSTILKILIEENCHFAIKSGGLARGAGSSNADGGVTIDLVRLNDVEIAKDRKSVKVGGGGKWFDVYSKLDPHGLTVLGGRVSIVGVGGFLLGGGISFFSQRYGWSCNSIISYDLVLPSGNIVNVDKDSEPDLLWALRGAGSSNFGIVTSFVMEAVELPNPRGVWFGINMYTQEKVPEILDHIQEVWTTTDKDLLNVNFYSYDAKENSFVFAVACTHPTHDDASTVPKSISSFANIENIAATPKPQIVTMATATAIIGSGMTAQLRNFCITFTYRPSREFDTVLYAGFEEEAVKLRDVPGLQAKLITQLLPPSTRPEERGGNCLGPPSDQYAGPLVLMVYFWSYDLPSDDQLVEETAVRCFNKMEAKAKEFNVWHPFRYMNYADEKVQAEQVWDGYGIKNVKRLREIQRKVDPTGVFTRGGLASGYFKLNSLEESVL